MKYFSIKKNKHNIKNVNFYLLFLFSKQVYMLFNLHSLFSKSITIKKFYQKIKLHLE
jgi:hypothetical protein